MALVGGQRMCVGMVKSSWTWATRVGTVAALVTELATEFQISRTTVMKHVERAGAPRWG
jgi:hypothetical protein